MDREPSNQNLMWLIVAGLGAWSAFLAVGAFLGLDPGTPDHDWRRMVAPLLAIGVFLGVWMGALWLRGRRH